MGELTKIHYNEHIRSHHPKSIMYWVTEGIIIDDKRYPIKEFRLKDDGLYAVVSQNDKEYFEVFLNTYGDTEILSQLKELNIRLTAEEQKVDKDTTYTAGNGLTLSGTKFSIDDSVVATLQELDAKKANKSQEAWITPTLVNGWYAIRPGEHPQYMKDEFGFVHFRGVVAKTAQSQSNVPFSLPTPYRPTVNTTFNLASIGPPSSRSLAVTIFSSTGNVDFAGAIAGTETWYALSSINFKGV